MIKNFYHKLPCGTELSGHAYTNSRIIVLNATSGGWQVDPDGKLRIVFLYESLEILQELLGGFLNDLGMRNLNPSALPDLYEACKEFVKKVDNHRARSVNSYAQMKEAIKKAERQND